MIDRKMRRFRQQLSDDKVMRILNDGKVAVWAVSGDGDYPYAVPLNYVYADGAIYVHSATQGHKIDAIKRNPKCSVCIIDRDEIVPEEFTSYFRSVIAFGRAELIESVDDKIAALQLLSAKYSKGIDPTSEINKFLNVVAIIKINIERVTGKEAIELTRKRSEG